MDDRTTSPSGPINVVLLLLALLFALIHAAQSSA